MHVPAGDHPDLPEHVRGVIIMGGAFGEKRGNRCWPCVCVSVCEYEVRCTLAPVLSLYAPLTSCKVKGPVLCFPSEVCSDMPFDNSTSLVYTGCLDRHSTKNMWCHTYVFDINVQCHIRGNNILCHAHAHSVSCSRALSVMLTRIECHAHVH